MSTETDTRPLPRLKQRYREEIVPALRDQFSVSNVMQVPTVAKVVVNMGVGEAARDAKLIDGAIRDLEAITGQKPAVTKARKLVGVNRKDVEAALDQPFHNSATWHFDGHGDALRVAC